MALNSLLYLALLGPAVGLYWLCPPRFRHVLLLVLSVAFYASWQPGFVVLPFVLAALAYVAVRQFNTDTKHGKTWLSFGLVAVLLPLVFFKYSQFSLNSWNSMCESLGCSPLQVSLAFAAPLGISFYTFTAVGVLLDSRQGRVKQPKFIDLSLLLSFWPYLLSGPIVRFREIVPQWTTPRKFDRSMLTGGFDCLVLGLAQKHFIANNLSAIVDEGFLPNAALTNSTVDNWMLAVAYGLQLYFDFAAYTNMAIGTARLLGIKLPENFRYPYHAANPPDFWARWHMSLSRWIRDYLFFPMNAKYGGAALPLYLSLVGIMAAVGLWHGAGWGFILWGTMHGVYLALWRIWERVRQKHERLASASWPNWLWRCFTLGAVILAWVPFRAVDLDQAYLMMRSMLWNPTFGVSYSANGFLAVMLFAGYCLVEPYLAEWIKKMDQLLLRGSWGAVANWYVVRPVAYAMLLFLFLVFDDRNTQFIYFQF